MRSMLHENINLTPTARTLWEIQERTCRLPMETATNLYTDVLRRLQDSLHKGDLRRAAVKDTASLAGYQQETRKLFLDCIGGVPQTPPDCLPRSMGRVECGAYAIEKLLLLPRKGAWATANVYVPSPNGQPRPAVLIVVGHDDRGKADPEYQYLAQLLAHAGIISLVLDPFAQGERFEHFEPELDFQPIQGCTGEHDLMDWKAKLMGLSLARYFIQDGVAALDYLASRPDVDANRIGLTGHSGGGTQTSLLTMAAGDRFACAAPCAYVTDAQAMIDTGIDPDNEMLWPGSLTAGLDYVDMLAGVCPRPVLLLANQNDFFPREGTLRTLDKARQLWAAAGSDIPPEMTTATSQHAYPNSLARAAATFFSTHLLGRDQLPADFTFVAREPAELWCTPEGQIMKYDPAMRTIHDELKDELSRLTAARGSVTIESLVPVLSQTLRLKELTREHCCRVIAEGVCGHYQYRCVTWRPQAGYWSSGVLMRDMRQGDKPLPTVIALWPEGASRITTHANWIHRAVRAGWQVLVMDVAASGALMPARLGTTSMYVGWSTMYNLNAYLIQHSDCIFALRTRQAAAAVDMLKGWPEADGARLCFYAEGEFSRYADMAALLTRTPVYSDEDYQPWAEIVTERYHDQTNTHEWVLPGALKYCDGPIIRDLLRQEGLLAPNPAVRL